MADVMWPPCLGMSDIAFDPAGLTFGGGQALDGSEMVGGSPAQRWTARLSLPLGDREDRVLAFRGLRNQLRGRRNTVAVPAADGRGPADRAGLRAPSSRHGVRFSSGVGFSDGTGFRQNSTGATLAAPAALNAIELTIRLPPGLRLLPGQRFSFADERMHEIARVAAFDGVGLWRVTVVPWLHADYLAGAVLDFERPVCRMRLAADSSANFSLRLNRFGAATLDLVQA